MPHANGRPTSAELIARHRAKEEWLASAIQAATAFARGHASFQGGEITEACRAAGVMEPENHNLWVGLPNILAGRGIIRKGRYVAPVTAHSHIKTLRQWHSLVYQGN